MNFIVIHLCKHDINTCCFFNKNLIIFILNSAYKVSSIALIYEINF